MQRILVATDLFGRGMDIERVNIVFNYDMPENSDSYLHRVARAGRFGTKVRNFLHIFARLIKIQFVYRVWVSHLLATKTTPKFWMTFKNASTLASRRCQMRLIYRPTVSFCPCFLLLEILNNIYFYSRGTLDEPDGDLRASCFFLWRFQCFYLSYPDWKLFLARNNTNQRWKSMYD